MRGFCDRNLFRCLMLVTLVLSLVAVLPSAHFSCFVSSRHLPAAFSILSQYASALYRAGASAAHVHISAIGPALVYAQEAQPSASSRSTVPAVALPASPSGDTSSTDTHGERH